MIVSYVAARAAKNLISDGSLIKQNSLLDKALEGLKGKKNMGASDFMSQLLSIPAIAQSPTALRLIMGQAENVSGDEDVSGVLDNLRNRFGKEGRDAAQFARQTKRNAPMALPSRDDVNAIRNAGGRYDDGLVFTAYGENGGTWIRRNITKLYPLMSAQRTIANDGVDTFTADILEDAEVIGIYFGIEGSATDVENAVTRLGGLNITAMSVGLAPIFATNTGHFPAVAFAQDSYLNQQLRGYVTTNTNKNLSISVINKGVSMNITAGAAVSLVSPFKGN